MANITLLNKQVRVHEQLSEALRQENLKGIEIEITFFLFAKISKSHKDDTTYILNMNELQQLTGNKYNLSEYIQAAKRLRDIQFTIDNQKSILVTGLLHEAEFKRGKGSVEVLISKKLKPYLIDLTKSYNKHQLFSMLRLKSKHSKIIYMYLCHYRPQKGYIRNTIEGKDLQTLKQELGYINSETGEEKYKKYGDFNLQVLKIAKKEINELTDIRFSYKPIKYGREVIALDINIENKNNEELISNQLEDFSEIIDTNNKLEDNLEKLDDFNMLTTTYELTETQAKTVLKRLDRDMLFETLKRVDQAKANNKIKKTVGGFSVTTIRNQFGKVI